jgi:hypothetical protein
MAIITIKHLIYSQIILVLKRIHIDQNLKRLLFIKMLNKVKFTNKKKKIHLKIYKIIWNKFPISKNNRKNQRIILVRIISEVVKISKILHYL